MIRHENLMAACEQLNDAALMGDHWPEALEALSRAAGSRGVMIMHNRRQRLMSFVSDESIREPIEDYLAGKAPPNARQTKIVHDSDPGFRLDFHDFHSSEIARDPYYQDYLRPLGLQWHANARLKMQGSDEIAVSFKREQIHGHYEAADKRVLDQILPRLRASAYIAECIFDAEARGMVRALHQRGRPVLEFDGLGTVKRQHGSFDDPEGPLSVRRTRAVTAEPHAQVALTKAIDQAVRPPRRQSLVLLNDLTGKRYLFQIVPVLGRARDVFLATSAVGVLIGRLKLSSSAFDMDVVRELFGLTVRESQIVGLLCEGCSTAEIAARLQVVPETVRFHLKAIFGKMDARSRVEVVALLAQQVR